MQKVGFRPGGSGLAAGTQEFRHAGSRGGEVTALAARAGRIGSGLLLAAGADNAARPGGRVPVQPIVLLPSAGRTADPVPPSR